MSIYRTAEFVTSGFGFVMATAIEMKRQFDTIRIEQDLQDFNSIIETELDKLLGYI